jgi:acetoin utilization deacetylase AcuC-like enzyme
VRAYAHDRFRFPLPDGHRFPIAKYGLVRAAVEALPGVTVLEAPPASWDVIGAVHDVEWVRRVRYGLLDRREQAGLGLPWSPALVTRAVHACGSTVAAARAALEDGVAATLGGGMHHAGHRLGRGYCTFNDVAVAIAALRAEGGARRVLILDLDVHQGDGNAELFARDRDVRTVSLHGARNYPFRRVPGDIDVELPDGTGDEAYLRALERTLPAALAGAPPDLAILICGADPWAGDRLGRLALTPEGLAARDERALQAVRATGAPVCVTLAGGYGEPIAGTAAIHARTVELAAAAAASVSRSSPAAAS